MVALVLQTTVRPARHIPWASISSARAIRGCARASTWTQAVGRDGAYAAPTRTRSSNGRTKHSDVASAPTGRGDRWPGTGAPRTGSGRRPARGFFAQEPDFGALGLLPSLREALGLIDIRRPSAIQAEAYRAVTSPHNKAFLLADYAGSGKTLAYLIPVLDALRRDELARADDSPAGTQVPGTVRGLVVVPTTELCRQVVGVLRRLAATGAHPLRTLGLTTAAGTASQLSQLRAGADVAVGTPQRLGSLLEDGSLSLERARFLVLDEVDVLLGNADFPDQTRRLLAALPADATRVAVSASLPPDLVTTLRTTWPGMHAVTGAHLHRPAPALACRLVDCSGGGDPSEETGFCRKAEALRRLLHGRHADARRTVVFCNKVDGCRKLENYLNRKAQLPEGTRVLPYHAAIGPKLRRNHLSEFMRPPRRRDNATPDPHLILVSTDRASRGLDTADVDHVVLFDFPRDASEFLRRVGRAGRGPRGAGAVSILVLGRQVPVAREMLRTVERGQPLYELPTS